MEEGWKHIIGSFECLKDEENIKYQEKIYKMRQQENKQIYYDEEIIWFI